MIKIIDIRPRDHIVYGLNVTIEEIGLVLAGTVGEAFDKIIVADTEREFESITGNKPIQQQAVAQA